MAETVAAVLLDYAFAEGSALAFEAAAAISANAAIINAVAIYTASAAYGGYEKRKAMAAARDRFNASLQDRLVMTATAQAARSRVYGRVRNVDGVLFKGTHGANSEFYTLVIALAGHEIDAVETVYANDVALTLDGSGYVQTAPYLVAPHDSGQTTGSINGSGTITLPVTPVAGSVTATWPTINADTPEGAFTVVSVVGSVVTLSGGPGSYTVPATVNYQVASTASKLRIRSYTGAPGQDLYSVLQPLVGSQVQSTDRFAGIACLVVTMEYSSDAYPGGVPRFSAVMRGAKINDPRTGTTAWSENPSLIARDWALYAHGGGCVTSEINGAAINAAANACDVSTTFTTPAGAQVRPLYQCGTVIPLDSNPDEALTEIVKSMAGQWGWAGGMLTLRAGIYRAPVATITEDWITDAAEITVVGAATADLVNVMRPSLADAAAAYVVAQAAEVRAEAYVTADGRELVREVSLGGITRAVHAQHVCAVLMREAREGLTVSLPCNLRAYELELFDVAAVTLPVFGWSAKEFEVINWQFSATGGVLLTLRETAAAIYTPDSSFDLAALSANTHLPDPSIVPRVTGLAATSNTASLADSSIISRLAVTWAAVASQAVRQSGSIEVQYHEANVALPAGDWASAAPVPGGATTATIAGLRAGVQYLVRARAINSLGVRGSWSDQILHQIGGLRAAAVYRQDSAPSAPQNGDTWIASNAGNRQYLRQGGAWVDVRDAGIQTALDAAAAAEATADAAMDVVAPANGPVAKPGVFAAASLSVSPADSNAAVEFRRDGTVYAYQDGAYTKVGDWYLANSSAVGDGFSVRFDRLASDTGTSLIYNSAVGAYAALSSARMAQIINTANAISMAQATVAYSVRNNTTGRIVCDGVLYLSADVDV